VLAAPYRAEMRVHHSRKHSDRACSSAARQYPRCKQLFSACSTVSRPEVGAPLLQAQKNAYIRNRIRIYAFYAVAEIRWSYVYCGFN
jgi:hypothetical protein